MCNIFSPGHAPNSETWGLKKNFVVRSIHTCDLSEMMMYPAIDMLSMLTYNCYSEKDGNEGKGHSLSKICISPYEQDE